MWQLVGVVVILVLVLVILMRHYVRAFRSETACGACSCMGCRYMSRMKETGDCACSAASRE